MIDRVFYLCVDILKFLARVFDTTYEAVNVWIFCIIWPLLTLALIVSNIIFFRKSRRRP